LRTDDLGEAKGRLPISGTEPGCESGGSDSVLNERKKGGVRRKAHSLTSLLPPPLAGRHGRPRHRFPRHQTDARTAPEKVEDLVGRREQAGRRAGFRSRDKRRHLRCVRRRASNPSPAICFDSTRGEERRRRTGGATTRAPECEPCEHLLLHPNPKDFPAIEGAFTLERSERKKEEICERSER
jgi:hypothetical protein